MNVCIPEIEESILIPAIAAEAMPDLLPHEELDMRVRTIKLLADIQGVPITPTPAAQQEATEVARQIIENPSYRPDYAKYGNETLAYLAGLVAQMNSMIVNELADLKIYVVNKLVYEIEHSTLPKDRIAALKALGDIDGVDAFKTRSELTINVKPIAEVERELLTILDNVQYSVIEGAIDQERFGANEAEINALLMSLPPAS